MIKEVFTSITLMDGSKCDILELKVYMIWIATFRQSKKPEMEVDITPFILEQIIRIDGKTTSIDALGDMGMDDYSKILDVVSVLMNKLPDFK